MKHITNHEYFNTETPESAYIAGFIMADGCICKNTSGNKYISMTLNSKDIEIMIYILSKLSPTRKPSICLVKQKSGYISNTCKFKITSNLLCSKLEEIYNIVERKTGKELLPNIKYKADFIRGLFDGDGCINKSNRGDYCLSIVSASEKMIDDLIKFFNFGYKTKIEKCYNFIISKRKNIFDFKNLIYYNKNSFFLKRKYDIIDDMPDIKYKPHIGYGECKSLKEWSKDKRCKVSYSTLKRRIKIKRNIEECLN